MTRVYERRIGRLKEVVSNVLFRNNALPKGERMRTRNELVRMLDKWVEDSER